MQREKIKVYTYTRVSTVIQIEGYSLEAQKARMKAFADYNDYEIVSTYEDAGKSGQSIEGRIEFNRMMEDIKSGKNGVSFVLAFKLSRFGGNAAVAEIERENIRVQTMEGRIQKAHEGKWNGGFALYGYQLTDGKLQINE